MDRRDFLKLSAATTTTTVAAATGAQAAAAGLAAPALTKGVRDLHLGSAWPVDIDGRGAAVGRLARRIELLSDGRLKIRSTTITTGGISAVASGAADLYFGNDQDSASLHPAIAYFAGLPRDTGLVAEAHGAWLAFGGGQALWDDLAADLGVKPFLVGHTAGCTGLWTKRPLTGKAGLDGLRIATKGLALGMLRDVGAEAIEDPLARAALALATGQLDAVEVDGAQTAIGLGIARHASYFYRSAVHGHGTTLTLGVNRAMWDKLSTTEQAIVSVATSEEARRSALEHRSGAWLDSAALVEHFGTTLARLSPTLQRRLDRAARTAVNSVGTHDLKASTIASSYGAFRAKLSGGQRAYSDEFTQPNS